MDPQLSEMMKRQRRKARPDRSSSSRDSSSVGDDTNSGGGGDDEDQQQSGKERYSRTVSDEPSVASSTTSNSRRHRERGHGSHREGGRRRRESDSRTVSSRDSRDSQGSAEKRPSRHGSKVSGRTPRPERRKRSDRTKRRTSLEDKNSSQDSSDHSLEEEGMEGSNANQTQSEDSSSDEEPQPSPTQTDNNVAGADGFASFGDTDVPAFAADFGSAPDMASAFGTTDTSGGGTSNFDAFGSFPTDFGTTTTTSNSAFAVDDVNDDDYQPPSFGFPETAPPPPPKPIYDKSPIDKPPTIPKKHIQSVRFANKSRPLLDQSSTPAPVANPLDGHLILCRKNLRQEHMLCEWNPHTRAQVTSIAILSQELQRKIAAKYGVTVRAVDNVLTLAVGLHRSHGYTRPRVAALLDLLVQDNNEVLRVIAIWQWGYSSTNQPVQLQSVVGPPSGSDFSYNTESLLISDSCIFVSGASAKGPCVFLCKPTVRDTWSANFVGKESSRIASMAATILSDCPYLAIALTDGSLSIWTYEAATKVTTKTTEALRRLLFPLCKLEGSKLLRQCKPSAWDTNDTSGSAETKEVGYCSQLEWVSPRASAYSQLLILVAAFQGGICFYHVALPKMQDKNKKGIYTDLKAPTASTQLSQTPSLRPFGLARWPAVYHRSFVSFCDLGPHTSPTAVVLLTGLNTNLDYARLALVSCQLSMYNGSTSIASKRQIWSTIEWKKSSPDIPRGLIPRGRLHGALYYSDSALQLVDFQSLANPGGFGSIPAGLTSSGTNLSAQPDKTGILSVYTTFHCERRKSSADPELLEWAPPSRRHWLVQTLIGDCKETLGEDYKEEIKDEEGTVVGGTQSSAVCELGGMSQLETKIPYRLARDSTGKYAAVWFRENSPAENNDSKTSDILIAMVEETDEKHGISQILEGRELVFLPPQMDEDGSTPCAQALIVSEDGGSIQLWCRKPSPSSKTNWQEAVSMACRPILGLKETDEKDYVECHRLMLQEYQDQVGLIAVATKMNGTSCLISSALQPAEGLLWSNMLPNIAEDPVLWLNKHEEVSMLMPLPSEQSIRGGIAVGTNRRIMILSCDMKILAEVPVRIPPSSIVPMGSFTIAYSSHEDHKIRYLSGLSDSFGRSGLIASFPLPWHNYCPHWLLAVRPDRFVYSPWHCGTQMVERGQSSSAFLFPTAATRPALLLEPMIANALATGGENTSTMPFFRTVVERFGRKVATMTHGEGEGIGNFGAGMTPRVFELLNHYRCLGAASWLLTGSVHFDRSANSRLAPSWMPISAKVKAALDADTHLHALANGDQYFSEYVKSPDHNMSSTLPRPSDPSAFYSFQFGVDAIKNGNAADALKLLDIAGTESSDALSLQLALAMQVDPFKDSHQILESLCPQDSQIGKSSVSTTAASLAALAIELKQKKGPSKDFTNRWMKQLAPSYQKGKKTSRLRPRIMGESSFAKVGAVEQMKDQLFSTETSEAKHVWNEGPNREKENLLMLDHIQEWFGRRKPIILGKEGAKSAEDRGASTLADILNQGDDDSFGAENDDDFKDGWVDGVGEGLKDEDKLSAYFRFSEGEDEESDWREDGFADITKFETKAKLFGCNDSAKLEESTSSVDEGESGKVKALFDVVFAESGVGLATALTLPATRGGSLDVGMMHGPEHVDRQKCSVEFWFWIPESFKQEIVLVRRTFGSSGDDLDSVCKASAKSASLWELVVSSKGELTFRTVAGGKLKSEPKPPGEDDDGPTSTIVFSRWNHVCITLKQDTITNSEVNVLVKGVSACKNTLSFAPPNFEADDFSGASAFDSLLEKSHLVCGLDHPAGFRMTEFRVWALERNDDDIRSFMTEYLECAEMKRKFRVIIKKKGGAASKLGGLPAPKSSGLAPLGGLAPPKGENAPKLTLAPPKGGLAPPGDSKPASRKGLLAPPKGSNEDEPSTGGFGFRSNEPTLTAAASTDDTGFGTDAFGGFGSVAASPGPETKAPDNAFGVAFGETAFGPEGTSTQPFKPAAVSPEAGVGDEQEEPEISPLWDSAIPLSEQVRSSAAAALIRGPPATRHFGGNRGGLPDYRELERLGVGAISICGSEKTIVWRDDQVPPGLTYPIGASGAIVSDQMDEDGSEFLCCFLAKDKRMVVFELSTRTVVVELQMTTKLNYWRFLAPEAGEDTLCFMLVTPVGGFHWMPLDESPRPRQVWKRGAELQGKKIVCYEEGGTNGLDGPDMLSKVGMLLVTNAATGGRLEAWLVPICGDSQAICASDDVMGACLCLPPEVGYEAWMPLLLFVVESEGDLVVCVSGVTETSETSVGLTEIMTDALIEQAPYANMDFEAPTLAMGTWPEVLCCSLGSTIVIVVRRKGLVVAYELAETGLELIAQENVGHYVVDAIMRYSAVEGGAEVVILMSDSENPRDGRVGTFCFRTAA